MVKTDLPIVVRGAREHNLQNVDLTLPRNKLICFTGVSGSGKSSLAFDTLYAEGQRRYLESLSTYARQFVGQFPKPDVDYLAGLSPSISISQKSTGNNPRSTVGTITELNDFLRILYARVGTAFCPDCQVPIRSQSRDQMIEKILQLPPKTPYMFLAPIIRGQKGEHRDLFDGLRRQGFNRARVDGNVYHLADPPHLERLLKHHIELVVDRIDIAPAERSRIADAIDIALKIGGGTMLLAPMQSGLDDTPTSDSEQRTAPEKDIVFSSSYSCPSCGESFTPPTPQLLSFNSPQGACTSCEGLGEAFNFDLNLLITAPEKSLRNGAIELVGKSSEMTRWYKRSLTLFAAVVEEVMGLEPGRLLKTSWDKLTPKEHEALLYGFAGVKVKAKGRVLHGQDFRGIVPELLDTFRATKNPFVRAKYEQCMRIGDCPTCRGSRLNPQANAIRLKSNAPDFKDRAWQSLGDVSKLSILDASEFFRLLELSDTQWQIGEEAVKEIRARLDFLVDVGLEYLSLSRTAPTLSGGESQRIRLATQIGSGLVGVLYVLDEPSIGLHPRDNDRLLDSLKRLRDLGNTLIVVEHDEDTMRIADSIVDFGPGPGVLGGQLISAGSLEDIASNPTSVTGAFLSRTRTIHRPEERRQGNGKSIKILGATHHNLKNIDVDIPLGCFVAITGVSGSGKSSLITEILSPAIRGKFQRGVEDPGAHQSIEGIENIDKVIDIDQSPIGRTPRSNPATYVKLFDEIRDLFAELPESKRRGFTPGTFSFNTEHGRCSACEGHGAVRLDMEFLADLWIPCAACEGQRYDRPTLQVEFKGKSIADCLNLDVQQAIEHFSEIPKIASKLAMLRGVGLDYLKLGQPSPTLSGGEAQRIKLAKELSRRSTGKTVYVLDEPTTGLHFHDIDLLLGVLQSLVERGNTVIVVEHNLDLIQAADWVIDLGPEGGAEGGEIVCQGTPEQIAAHKQSYTGQALKKYFDSHSKKPRTKKTKAKKVDASDASGSPTEDIRDVRDIRIVGAKQHNLQNVDVDIPRGEMTVLCGQSGSGKTSLAMDTLYAEGQRRFIESLSPYVRQFVGQMPKANVDRIEGLSPSVAIEQRNLSHTPRSTVGTVTEIYDYVRVLFARLGQMHCTQCDAPVSAQTSDQIIDRLLGYAKDRKGGRALLMAPVAPATHHTSNDFYESLQRQGFVRIRINGRVYEIGDAPELDTKNKLEIQLVVDRLQWDKLDRKRLSDSVSTALTMGNGMLQIAFVDEGRSEIHWDVKTLSLQLACNPCGLSFHPLTPHSFSFNSAAGWCESCQGIGVGPGISHEAVFDASLSLNEGGLRLWNPTESSLSAAMLKAFCRETGIDPDRPTSELPAGQRSMLLKGLANREINVLHGDMPSTDSKENREKAAVDPTKLLMSFQYKGVYQAIESAYASLNTAREDLQRVMTYGPCVDCDGARVRREAAHARFRELSIVSIVHRPIGELFQLLNSWKLNKREQKVAGELLREILHRLKFLNDVGLDYLNLDRAANTLSGGEAQRIRLASQLGAGLSGVLYVLDEPTIGLHPRDNQRLIGAMKSLRDLGNTLVVVEHDREVIASSDQVRDFGPASGPLGGNIVAAGSPAQITKIKTSITGPFLNGKRGIPMPEQKRITLDHDPASRVNNFTDQASNVRHWLTIEGAQANTLRDIDVSIPLKCFTAITGPSGSGKSSLINGILYPALSRRIHMSNQRPGAHRKLAGTGEIRNVLRVDQSPLGLTPASNPATYTGVFDHIRNLYNSLPAAKARGFQVGHFSFNVPGGRCEMCEGLGQRRIQMHFLPDVWIECESCHGRRYIREVLEVTYRDVAIDQLLSMSIGEARDLMSEVPRVHKILDTLCQVGLDYVSVGQSAPTLSGGEAQRVKLAAELCRSSLGSTLYLLDEPTTGLHFNDIIKLMDLLQSLVNQGHTVVVIEHNLDVIKCADWVIDLGPEAGAEGGDLVFAGPPEKLASYAANWTQPKGSPANKSLHRSYTGEALIEIFAPDPPKRKSTRSAASGRSTNSRSPRSGNKSVSKSAAPK